MKPSTKDQLEGKLRELKGTAKEKAGQCRGKRPEEYATVHKLEAVSN